MSENTPNSVLEVALLAEAPKQWNRFQKNRTKRIKGLPKWKRDLEEIDSRVADAKAKAEELRRRYDPELMQIQANLDRKIGVQSIGLHCSRCGEPDRQNRINGKPWCGKCNKSFVDQPKTIPRTKRLDVTFRGLE